jgi:hypothetical protein
MPVIPTSADLTSGAAEQNRAAWSELRSALKSHLAGTGADLVELGVTQEPPGRVVVDVAVAAEQLDRDMYVSTNAAKAYVYAVAQACDRGETTREDAAGAILNCLRSWT